MRMPCILRFWLRWWRLLEVNITKTIGEKIDFNVYWNFVFGDIDCPLKIMFVLLLCSSEGIHPYTEFLIILLTNSMSWNTVHFQYIRTCAPVYSNFSSLFRDESLLCQGLSLNDDLLRVLSKHEAVASGTSVQKGEPKPELVGARHDDRLPLHKTGDNSQQPERK